jgi:hypothetical protein
VGEACAGQTPRQCEAAVARRFVPRVERPLPTGWRRARCGSGSNQEATVTNLVLAAFLARVRGAAREHVLDRGPRPRHRPDRSGRAEPLVLGGSVVPWAEAGVGAVATQSFVDPSYGSMGWP